MRWTELSVIVKLKMLKFWNKLIDLGNDRITKKTFLKDFHTCKRNRSTDIKFITEEINQQDIYN